MSTMASRRPRDTMSRSTRELRERLHKMGPKGNAAALQIAELAGTLPGWRWIEDEVVDGDETTRYVHLWVRLAAGVGPADVTFRAKKGATNAIHLACGRDVVFDDRFRLMSDVDGGDAEWTVEGDAKRGGALSVHVTLTRCKSVGYIPWPRPFRNQAALDPDLDLFRKPCFGDGAPPPPKPPPKAKPARRRRAKQSTTVVCESDAPVVEDVTTPAKPKVGDFYGVPVTDASGAWSIVTGAAAATTESHLHARPKRRTGGAGDAAEAPAAAAAAAPHVADGVCAAVEAARAAAREATPPAPPGDDDDDDDDDFIVEGLDKVLFPARIFDPFFSLGLTIHEDTLHVLAVARGGQGERMGVVVGWRAVYVGETQAPLASLQQLINELTGARQEKKRLPVYFEGDARE